MTLPRRMFLTGAAALTLFPAPTVLAGVAPTQTLAAPAFGTGWRLVLPAGAPTDGLEALIAAELAGIDAQMSPWRADSAITRINRAGPGGHAVPAQTATVAQAALALAIDSGGAFDPTVGPLVARWGFGPIAEGGMGIEGLTAGPGEIVKARAGQTLDLCGIAKGHALDRVAALLAMRGHDAFLLDLGGELTARGGHPSGRQWQIAVEDPRPGHDGMADVLALDGLAVATSGDRVNAYDLGGRRISHIIDPATGQPAAGGIASVTVVAADGMIADGWATALFAAGADAGPKLAAAQGLPALFLIHDGEGLRRIATPEFARHLA